MRAAAQQAAIQHDNARLAEDERFARQYALLINELVSAAQRIRAHFAGSRASIYLTEQPFSGYTVRTANGEAAVSGKIDRIAAAAGISASWIQVLPDGVRSRRYGGGDFAAAARLYRGGAPAA
jgi:hypothetical protein